MEEDEVRPLVSHQEAQENLLELLGVQLFKDWESVGCSIHAVIRYHVVFRLLLRKL